MQEMTYILPWVLASVTMGVVVGVYLGRGHGKGGEVKSDRRERETTLKVLGEVLRATEQMMSNVECHNSRVPPDFARRGQPARHRRNGGGQAGPARKGRGAT